jgi:hypothetical protein
MPDFTPDDLFEGGFQDPDHDFYDNIQRDKLRDLDKKRLSDANMVQSKPFTNPVAIAIIDKGPLSIRYLLQYDDHPQDDYNDEASKRFKAWFLEKYHAPEVAMYYAAVCVEESGNKRPNNTSGNVASDFFKEFNRSGYGYFDSTKYGVKKLIQDEVYTTRIGRMYNVWFREEFTKADGSSLFSTEAIGLRFHSSCQVCGSKRDNYGRHHLDSWLLNASPETLRALHHRLRPLLLDTYPINWDEGFREGRP